MFKKINNYHIFILIIIVFILNTILFRSVDLSKAQWSPPGTPGEQDINIPVNPLQEDLSIGNYSIVGNGNIDIEGNICAGENCIESTGNITFGGTVNAANGMVIDRVIYQERWPAGDGELGQELGDWTMTSTVVPTHPASSGVEAAPYWEKFSWNGGSNVILQSPCLDFSNYLEGNSSPNDLETFSDTRVLVKGYIFTESMDGSTEYLAVEVGDGANWKEVYRDQSNEDSGTDAGWKKFTADITPYITSKEDDTSCTYVRFNAPFSNGGGDYLGVGALYFMESDQPSIFSAKTGYFSSNVEISGNVSLGNTQPSTGSNAEVSLRSPDATGHWAMYQNTAGDGSSDELRFWNGDNNLTIDSNGNITARGLVTGTGFLYSSDLKLKKDIKKISNPLNKITQLNGVSFKWKENNEQSLGLIAQDVEKVFPELVFTNNNGFKTVAYGNLVAPLIEAIKFQQKEIEDLNKKIEDLKILIK